MSDQDGSGRRDRSVAGSGRRDFLATAALVTSFSGALASGPQAPNGAAALAGAQAAANRKSGPRHVPAKDVPVPATLAGDPAMAAAVAAPYSPLWDLVAPDHAGWRAIVTSRDALAAAGAEALRARLGVAIEPMPTGGVNAYLLTPKGVAAARRGKLILHLHGGGWIFGNGLAGTVEAVLIAAYTGHHVLSLDYALAPDHPFPAGLDDVLAAWKALATVRDPRGVALHGTSASANIALAALLRMRAEGLPMPGALGLTSPPADARRRGDSWRANEWLDNVIVSPDGPYITAVQQLYQGLASADDPLVSPLLGDFTGFPPAIVATGTRDVFLSDAAHVHRKLRQAKVPAELLVFEAVSHSSFIFAPTSNTSRELYTELGEFFDRRFLQSTARP